MSVDSFACPSKSTFTLRLEIKSIIYQESEKKQKQKKKKKKEKTILWKYSIQSLKTADSLIMSFHER